MPASTATRKSSTTDSEDTHTREARKVKNKSYHIFSIDVLKEFNYLTLSSISQTTRAATRLPVTLMRAGTPRRVLRGSSNRF